MIREAIQFNKNKSQDIDWDDIYGQDPETNGEDKTLGYSDPVPRNGGTTPNKNFKRLNFGGSNAQQLAYLGRNLKALDDRNIDLEKGDLAMSMKWGGITPKDAQDPNNPSYQHDYLFPSKYGQIRVDGDMVPNPTYYDHPIHILNLYNIDVKDCAKIEKMLFGKRGNSERINFTKSRVGFSTEGGKNASIQFIIDPRQIEAWKTNDLEKIINFLSGVTDENGQPTYFKNEEEIGYFRNYVDAALENQYEEELKDSMSSYQSNWELMKLINELESEEGVQEFMELYRRIGFFYNKYGGAGISDNGNFSHSFGHVLSLQNAMIVFGSNKLTLSGKRPTFILTQKQWAKMGRVVKPGATRYHIYMPSDVNNINKKKSPRTKGDRYQITNTKGEKVTIASSEDILYNFYFGQTYDQLSQQQKIAMTIMCDLYKHPRNYLAITEFDIDDTELIDPNYDPFNKEIGLINRFNFTPNQPAMEFLEKMKGTLANNTDESENTQSGEEEIDIRKRIMDKNTEILLNIVEKYADKNNIKFTKYGNDNSVSLINGLNKICESFVKEELGRTREDVIRPIINTTIFGYCFFYGAALDVIYSMIPKEERYDLNDENKWDEVSLLLRKLDTTIREFEKEMDNENIAQNKQQQMIAEGVLDKLGKSEDIISFTLRKFAPKLYQQKQMQKRQMTESFKKMLNRMDESKYNVKNILK